ncbi:hypothetical protein A3D42_02025 [Candidatus Nomurabacteria bacterium RIFCSPHIGHO2_02_FULL_41_18]|uniref:VTT domain-containing protein n=1 Tax=Candidatus Nomurabacteria bacterium RIFCSPHIGHO2_02_FULL_41_18 TaxID=1801754 RepID=A0A1F6W5W9_9BACT|nr:MAG: hypothetical protein A2737_00590 [Candidatus Nomurabacteria bacterium RIFCSPHIGHO2_01_FULL_41_71]OGI77310.1 MAG: hypothetical protein A3D42_02025 [Candidatus Nomurabacteria bacterium RIFCSPHIGHO2_02_FULL_41_18]OGI89708.1 MAG: hypothetical protein A3B01_02750 [Candidatus Nomurabacteria bacterium RIFCSPLOWO2_01_FULL_41_52b]OGJ00218.1 MAG: hypothetical protein A3I90_01410 [Candidatus Nomurabacteria bacterium RIFCSPLOWO2_02_FULL_41_9]
MSLRLLSPQENKILQYIALPLIVLVFYVGLIYLYKFLGLPSSGEIINFAKRYYENYGYWVVLVGALVEGALFINWYLPGSVVVALGVVFARSAGLNVFFMLFLVITGFFLTALLNYALGRFGWYHIFLKLGLEGPLLKIQAKVKDQGLRALFTAYVHPNFGALAATAAGILRLSFYEFFFYSLISIITWNSFWTLIFYYFGSALLNHLNFLIILGGIFVYFMFVKNFRKSSVNIP